MSLCEFTEYVGRYVVTAKKTTVKSKCGWRCKLCAAPSVCHAGGRLYEGAVGELKETRGAVPRSGKALAPHVTVLDLTSSRW